MFEHFQLGESEQAFQLDQTEVNDVIGIVDEIAEFNEGDDFTDPMPKKDVEKLLHALTLMSFRAGRSYQVSVTDEEYVTVHIPTGRAGKFIEMLLAE